MLVSRAGQAALLALLLGVHLLTRLEAHSVIPLGERHFYPTGWMSSPFNRACARSRKGMWLTGAP
jgi:hypothetical protein